MAASSVYRSSLFAETAKHEAGNRALMTIYHRLYLKALREERRLELASGDQAKNQNNEKLADDKPSRVEP